MTSLPDPGCVVKVGDGRGFIIKHRVQLEPPAKPIEGVQVSEFCERRLVITAVQCLPTLPPADVASSAADRSYKLLGTLDGSKADILAECLFVNPVAGIAVLDCPDREIFFDEAAAYDELIEGSPFLRMDKAQSGQGWVLSLDGHWVPTTIETGDYTSIDTDGPNEAGMSGSPILNNSGRAVGVVVIGNVTATTVSGERQEESGPHPKLSCDLPAWLFEGF